MGDLYIGIQVIYREKEGLYECRAHAPNTIGTAISHDSNCEKGIHRSIEHYFKTQWSLINSHLNLDQIQDDLGGT